MKTIIHQAKTRGLADYGWLKSYHTFSFASYYNPNRMGFGALRVINDDVVAPTKGFDTHPHQNMEIISIPLRGTLRHKDTMGNDFIIEKGEVQVMSAGTGVYHSEYNHSQEKDVNFLQIWVLPKKINITPRYSQKSFSDEGRKDQFQLIVSPDGRDQSVEINQEAFFSLIQIGPGKRIPYSKYHESHGIYVFVLEGILEVGQQRLMKRDGLAVAKDHEVVLTSHEESEVLVMEIPMLENFDLGDKE